MQTLVILSEADGSRSEASAKSKDPLPACVTANSARNFYHRPEHPNTGNWPLGTGN
jgi:hypothetical protein